MFDLIQDRKRTEIQWWTFPTAVFTVFCAGVNLGILIGRRDTELSDWLMVAFLLFVSCWIVWPMGREIMHRRTPDEMNDGK